MVSVILFDGGEERKDGDNETALESITTFQRIPGFRQESMYFVETNFHNKLKEYPYCILLDREADAKDCVERIYNLVRQTTELNYDGFYMMPAVGLVCEDRSSCYDLYYWPLSNMLYAIDIADQSYVYGLLIAP